jgi:hypothetical protein
MHSSSAKVDEYAAEVVGILLDLAISDLRSVEKPQDTLLQLDGTLAREDFDERRLVGDGFINDGVKSPLDLSTAVIDVV